MFTKFFGKKRQSNYSFREQRQLLVSGYVKKKLIKFDNVEIPNSIVTVIFEFFYQNYGEFLFLWMGSANGSNTKFHFSEILSLRQLDRMFKLQITNVHQTKELDNDRAGFGQIMISHQSLPKWVDMGDKRENCKYHIVIRSGGIYSASKQVTDMVDILAIPSHNISLQNDTDVINAYNVPITPLPSPNKCPTSIYSRDYGLICVGGRNDNYIEKGESEKAVFGKDVVALDWNETGQWKHLDHCKLIHGRISASLCLINATKLAVLSGYVQPEKFNKTVEILTLNDENCGSIEMAEMNSSRAWASSVYVNNKLVIGGGDSIRLEWCDLTKNKWNLFNNATNYMHQYPLIWTDAMNQNIIYIAGQLWGSDQHAPYMGNIEWIDMRSDNKKNTKWNILNKERTLNAHFKLAASIDNMRQSRIRALLV